MKKLLFILCLVLTLASCSNTKYHLVIVDFNNNVVVDTTIICKERAWFEGEDARDKVNSRSIFSKDTTYVFYNVTISDQKGYRRIIENYDKPIYVKEFRCTKPR